jgi:hypothetical protein
LQKLFGILWSIVFLAGLFHKTFIFGTWLLHYNRIGP